MAVRICSPHCGVDPESTSGGETYERELLRHLAARGAVVDLLLARHKRYPEGVPNWIVHRLPIGRGLRWPVAMLLLPPIIARLHRTTRFDLLRAHSLRFIGPAALIARRRYRLDVPIVSHHHHLDPSWLNPVIERRVIEGSERVITVSEFSRRQLVEALGVSGDRIEVVPNGIDEHFAPAGPGDARRRLGLGDGPVALFLGGLKPRKNLAVLLDAWREVARQKSDARLVLAGTGPLEAGLRRRAAALGLSDRVVFTGRVAEADKVACYNAADLFVSPSSLEGFGFTVGEAMSCGLPVIVSDRGALPELVVDGEGGFVCRHGDAGALARRVLLLLGDAPLRARFGRFNRERIDRRFRWDRAARRVLEIYDEVLAEWKRGVNRTP
jgi:phosphatidylinositol alpha-1,6-mannosyltransferase